MRTYNILAPDSGLYFMREAAGDATFYFLPFLLAITAAKKFKTNQPLALVLAGIYMYPTIVNAAGESISVLGISVKLLRYSNSVIPILLSVWLLSFVYDWVYKHTIDSLRIVIVPIISLLVLTPVSLMLFGPIGFYGGELLGKLFVWLFDFSPLLAGIVIGGSRPFVILTGMHMAISPVLMNNIATLGYDMIGPVYAVATMAVAGMSFGIFLRSKDTNLKSSSFSSFISAFIAVTEPALYGIAFRYKKPLWATVIGGSVAGAFVAFRQAKAITFAMPSIVSLPAYAGTIPTMLVGLLISFVLSASLAYVFGTE